MSIESATTTSAANAERHSAFATRTLELPLADGYEIWFSVIIDSISRRAFWLRHSILHRKGKASRAVVWASLFDADEPGHYCALTQLVEMQTTQSQTNSYHFGGCQLDTTHAHGQIDEKLQWKFSFEHKHAPHTLGPNALKRGPLRFLNGLMSTHSNVTSPFGHANGCVTVNGNALEFVQAHAHSMHIWGSRRVAQIFWLFVPQFDGDAEGFQIEVAAVRVKPNLPLVLFVSYGFGGVIEQQMQFAGFFNRQVQEVYPELKCTLQFSDTSVQLTASLDALQTTCYIYREPNGQPFYIEQSDTSTVQCRFTRDGKTRELQCNAHAALEFHGMSAWSSNNYLDPYAD